MIHGSRDGSLIRYRIRGEPVTSILMPQGQVNAVMHQPRHCLCHLQQIKYRIDPRHVLESEILVIQNHPLVAFFHGHMLDVREERYGDDYLASVCKAH